MPPLPGGKESVGGGVREEGHGGRPHVHGASEGTGIMQGVRRFDGGGIPDESSDGSIWEGGGDTTAMEKPGRRGRATDFTNEFPGKGRSAEIPGGGMPGPSGDKYGNAGAITEMACPQHRGNSGGGKLPPPTVRPLQHPLCNC